MRKRASTAIAIPGVAMLMFAGCDILTGPDDDRVMGVIGAVERGEVFGGVVAIQQATGSVGEERECELTLVPDCINPPPLEAPDTVVAGEPFEIVVRTSGACTWRADGAEISQSGATVEVVPYDRVSSRRGVMCPQVPHYPFRIVELVFTEAGDALIRITGRVIVRDGGEEVERIVGSIEHRVVVR